jgi:aminodeoxyfutalosine synthase
MLGRNLAQVALRFGADDLDGTINDGGSLMESYLVEGNDNQLTREQIEELIRGAGRVPVERDTLYNTIKREPAASSTRPNLALPVVEADRPRDDLERFQS